MSWERMQYVKRARRPQHARVPLCVVGCVDCGRVLPMTHLIERFEGRCRACFDAFWSAAAMMASHYVAEEVSEE